MPDSGYRPCVRSAARNNRNGRAASAFGCVHHHLGAAIARQRCVLGCTWARSPTRRALRFGGIAHAPDGPVLSGARIGRADRPGYRPAGQTRPPRRIGSMLLSVLLLLTYSVLHAGPTRPGRFRPDFSRSRSGRVNRPTFHQCRLLAARRGSCCGASEPASRMRLPAYRRGSRPARFPGRAWRIQARVPDS